MSPARARILLVEDDDGHAALVRRAVNESALKPELVRMQGVEEAREWLAAALAREQRLPDLALVDLRLRRSSGIEFIRGARANPALERLPIIVLTTSDAPPDLRGAYEAGANGYVVKPVGWNELRERIESVLEYWVRLNRH